MIFSREDFPEPLRPSTPIFAPGKKLRETSFKICRLGGTVLVTWFIEKTYWAMDLSVDSSKTGQQNGCTPAVIIRACDNTHSYGLQLPETSAFQLGTMDAVPGSHL
ncbi:MAG: hypothetical protein RR720_22960 [Comamonas sp.]|uniref:hypothetical protein n=1 Tax=Comamonas sp. TaxID=34028 RepID=UPI002FC778E6